MTPSAAATTPRFARATHVVPPAHQLIVGVPCTLDRATTVVVSTLKQWGFLVSVEEPAASLTNAFIPRSVARQVLALDARHANLLLAHNPSALIEMPLTFMILASDGGATVRCNDPAVVLANYDGLSSVAEELSGLCQSVLRAVIRACSDSRISGPSESAGPLLRIQS